MTAEPDLLPELVAEGLDFFNLAGDEGDKLYVRAIRQHIAAQAAEIEALRAEAAEWKRVAAAQAELHDEAEARADKLAEALRHLRNHTSVNSHQIELIDAVLEQEKGSGYWPEMPKNGGPDWTGYGG